MRADASRKAAGYDAFMSYSQAVSGKLAAALQDWLERFATPWYRPRSLRIFRDYTSMSASEDLWQTIEQGLSSCAHFILLASPEAAQSRWVNREVAWWRQNRLPGTAFIVLTGGELFWDDELGDWDWQRTTALPSAARGMFSHEPLWVDLSRIQTTVALDRSNPVLLNSVAQIAGPLRGVDKDVLVGEHITYYRRARRQRRWGAAALAILAILATVAAVLARDQAGVAVNQRGIAVQQRDRAVSAQLAALSENLASTNPMLAAQLASAAWRIAHTSQAAESMLDVFAQPERAILSDNGLPGSTGLAVSEGLIAASYANGTVRIWNIASHRTSGPPLEATAHGTAAYGVALSRDGKLLAAAGGDGYARLWDLRTRKLVWPPVKASIRGAVNAIAFSPSGKLLATGAGDGTARLWDVATGRPSGPPIRAAMTGSLNAIAFSPNGRLLATAGRDGVVRLWSVITGKLAMPPVRASTAGGVLAIAFSPGGGLLATGGSDGYLRLWRMSSGRFVRYSSENLEFAVRAVGFSPRGNLVATGDSSGDLSFWNVRSLTQFPFQEVASAPGNVNALEFLPASNNGLDLATAGGDGTIRLWDTRICQEQGPAVQAASAYGTVYGVAFSANGKIIATSDDGGVVRLWNVATLRQIGKSMAAGANGPNQIAFSPTANIFATGGGSAQLWNAATQRRIGPAFNSSPGGVDAVAFSPNGKLLAVANGDGAVGLWSVAAHTQIGNPIEADPRGVDAIAFSLNGEFLATADVDGTAKIWSVTTHHLRYYINTGQGGLSGVNFIHYGKGPTLLTAGNDGTARLWDVAAERQIGAPLNATPPNLPASDFLGSDEVEGVAPSPDGQIIAVVDDNDNLELWDTATNSHVGPFMTSSQSGQAYAVAFSPDGKIVATGAGDGTLRLWDVGFPANLPRAMCDIAGHQTLSPTQWTYYIQTVPYQNTCPDSDRARSGGG